MKHKKYANIVLSFDSTDMTYYAHFTFKNKVKQQKVKLAKTKAKKSISGLIKRYNKITITLQPIC